VVLSSAAVSARPGPILVVDASPERLRACVAVLRHGFGPASVRGTTDPEDAAGWIACERPAVLVTPADTANTSGAAVVEELRGRWGPVPIVVTHGPGFNALPPPVVHLPAPVDPVRLRAEVGRWVPGAGAGSIATTLLSDVLALYARAGLTGVLDVRAPVRTGSVWFADGELVHASCGVHTGASALFEVLCWNEGRFTFRRELSPAARSLSGSLPELLARADAVAEPVR